MKMVHMGAKNLSKYRDQINKLNVFPVPDGDTGTNMNLSMTSGMKEMDKRKTEELPIVLKGFVRGLLMGARGNSGVILSQLFRGFVEELNDRSEERRVGKASRPRRPTARYGCEDETAGRGSTRRADTRSGRVRPGERA